MGTEQWIDTYRFLLTEDVSPTITDMIDSVRSKIFSILKIIERDGVKYEMARQHYKILLEELPTKDCVRYIILDQTTCSNIVTLNFLHNIRMNQCVWIFLGNTMLRRDVSKTEAWSDVDGA